MSVNIDSLDIEIRTSAGSSAMNIEALAKALGNLRSNGKLTSVTNNLNKLASALNALNPALAGLNTEDIQKLSSTMGSLASIQKLSGLESAIRTLKKIPSVMDNLGTAELERFKTQMEKLAAALAPLAKQMDQVGKAFDRLPSNMRKAIDIMNGMAKATDKAANATDRHSKGLNASGINLMAGIHNFESLVHVLNMVSDAIAYTMAEAIEWDGIQYRFGRAFGEDAQEVYQYVQKVNDVLGINIQQFMQYSSLYGSLLSGFGIAQDKVTTISVGLTELSYDIWAAYNDRFKTLESASEAVRSAITGEIEPIRNAGIALTEASLQEYLDSIGMATVSIQNLSEAQKAEVRYAAMMDAAMNQGIVGTYAAEMQTAEGAVRSLSQSFKGLVQAFGSLFIPILQVAIPYLTAFVNLLVEAVHWIASFFGITIGKIDWGGGASDMASGLEDAAAGAGGVASGVEDAAGSAKKLKDYMMGFDELNVISPPTETGGGGGGGGGAGDIGWEGLDLNTMWDDSVFAQASKQLDKIKKKLKPLINWLKNNFDDILDIVAAIGLGFLAWKITTNFTAAIDNLIQKIKDPSFFGKVNRIAMGITLMVTGFTLAFKGGYDLGYEGVTLMNIVKAALGAALGIAGSLLVFGTGPVGWTIGIATALIVTVAGFKIGADKKAVEDEIKRAFGEIKLTDELVELYVNKITAVSKQLTLKTTGEAVTFDAALKMYVSESATLKSMQESIQNVIDEIETYDFKIALGVTVSQEDYLSAVERLVSESKVYLDQHYLVLSIALSFLDDETGDGLSDTLTTFYTENSAELESLGAKLKTAISEAFVDGEWIPDKLEEAKRLQKEIQEITEYAANVEYRAKLQGLKLSVSKENLTFESFQEVLDGAKEAISEKLETLEEVKMSQLQVAIMDYDANIADGMSEQEAKEIYNQTVADIEKQYQNSKVEVEYGTFDFGLETIQSAFQEDLEKAKADGSLDFNTLLSDIIAFDPGYIFDDGSGDVYGNINAAVADLSYYYTSGLTKIAPDVRDAMGEVLKAMEPQVEDYKEIGKSARKAGITVPEKVREGLNDYQELKALSGDAEAINYMIGKTFSTDPTFLNTLSTVKDAGMQLDESMAEGLLNNLDIIRDPATGIVTEIKSAITGETLEITPELVENMKQLGVDISDGLYNGADAGMQENKQSFWDWAIWPWNWFKEANEIHSPSKLFESGGNYLTDGLKKGIDTGWNDLKGWFATNIAPVFTLEYWQEKFDTVRQGASDKLEETQKKIEEKWDNIKRWYNTNIAPKFTKEYWRNVFDKVVAGASSKLSELKGAISEKWQTVVDWYNETVAPKLKLSYWTDKISSFLDVGREIVENIKEGLNEKWEELKKWWSELELPEFKIKKPHLSWESKPATGWIAETLEALGLPTSLPDLKVKWYAQGGLPDMGELFVAREAGPELVGRIGSHSAVANNDQIVEAVSRGVYSAVVEAMSTTGGNNAQPVYVYLDGKQIYSSIKKTEAERGVSIMGNQLGYAW